MISDEERYSIAMAGEKRGFEKGISEGIAPEVIVKVTGLTLDEDGNLKG